MTGGVIILALVWLRPFTFLVRLTHLCRALDRAHPFHGRLCMVDR